MMSEHSSLYDALVAAELDDRPACLACIHRPKRWLGRYRHRLWICICGQAWRTERGPYEKVTWLWRRWPQPT